MNRQSRRSGKSVRHPEVPVMAAGNINRMEDVKKLIYAGCARVVLNFAKTVMWSFSKECPGVLEKEKMLVCISSLEEYEDHKEMICEYASGILALDAVPKMQKVQAAGNLPYRRKQCRVTAVASFGSSDRRAEREALSVHRNRSQ